MILWSVEESQPASTEPLRSVRRCPGDRSARGRVFEGRHWVLPEAVFWIACCWLIQVWNCAGVTIFSVNSILLW